MNKPVKHILLISMVLFLAANVSFGQRLRERVQARAFRDVRVERATRRIENVKENYISRRLNLTPDQSEKFIPVYRQYQDELINVRQLKRANNSSAQADGTEQIDKELYYETQLVNIRKHYNDQFLKILPPEKVSELYKSEREFNDEMIKQLSERSVAPPPATN